jgi:hypothetical protein
MISNHVGYGEINYPIFGDLSWTNVANGAFLSPIAVAVIRQVPASCFIIYVYIYTYIYIHTYQASCFCCTDIPFINTVLILTMWKNKHPYLYFGSLLHLFMLLPCIACPANTNKNYSGLRLQFSDIRIEFLFWGGRGGGEIKMKYLITRSRRVMKHFVIFICHLWYSTNRNLGPLQILN